MTTWVSSQKNVETFQMCLPASRPVSSGLDRTAVPCTVLRPRWALGTLSWRAPLNSRCSASGRRETCACTVPCYHLAPWMPDLVWKTLWKQAPLTEGKSHHNTQGVRVLRAPDKEHQGRHFPEERGVLTVPESNIHRHETSDPWEHARRNLHGHVWAVLNLELTTITLADPCW